MTSEMKMGHPSTSSCSIASQIDIGILRGPWSFQLHKDSSTPCESSAIPKVSQPIRDTKKRLKWNSSEKPSWLATSLILRPLLRSNCMACWFKCRFRQALGLMPVFRAKAGDVKDGLRGADCEGHHLIHGRQAANSSPVGAKGFVGKWLGSTCFPGGKMVCLRRILHPTA